MSISRLTLILAAATVLLAGVDSFAAEADLIAALKTGATHKVKADACRQLSRVGTKNSVPVLASMLGDEKLGHMARYALETIDDPSVDEALREAAGRLKGRPLVGVVGSLGVRRDVKSIAALAGMLADSDGDVARAAARALGLIATPDAIKALTDALGEKPSRQRRAVCEALLRCAEMLTAAGGRERAVAIYSRLAGLNAAPHQVRAAALRGGLLAPEKGNLPLLRQALHDKQYVMFAAATRASLELRDQATTAALAGELTKLPAERQLLVAQTLGARGDATAGPALIAAARTGDVAVRIAAVRALTRLGHAPAVGVLAELARGDDAKLADEAQKCLANFPGQGGQAAVLALLNHKDPAARRLAVEMIGRRGMTDSTAVVLKTARDDDADVRAASLRVLRDTARAGDLPALLGLLVEAKTPADVQGAENALRALTAREARTAGGRVVIRKAVYGDLPDGKSANVTRKLARLVKAGATSVEASNTNFGDPAQSTPKKLRVDFTIDGVARSQTVRESETVTFAAKTAPPAFVAAFGAALPEAPAEAKPALLRILRSAGGPVALKTVRQAFNDEDKNVAEAAFRALCEWPSADALPAVAEFARSAKSPTRKVLALRAYIRLAGQQVAPPDKLAASLADAMALADRNDEKRLILSALGNIPSPAALKLVMPHLANSALKEEACLAAVTIAEKIVKASPKPVAEAMQQVAQRAANKKTVARAKALLPR
jgi:HEAT repeat protein